MLHDWTNLFNITGAAGGELIGLLFVIVTLGAGLPALKSTEAIRAFVTPTLVNFSGVLLQAIVVLAPWPSLGPPGVILILGGLAGVAYRAVSIGWKRKADYVALSPFDWAAYNGIPLVANASVAVGGLGLIVGNAAAPFAIAGASTLMLAAGIYGAWDTTLWILRNRRG